MSGNGRQPSSRMVAIYRVKRNRVDFSCIEVASNALRNLLRYIGIVARTRKRRGSCEAGVHSQFNPDSELLPSHSVAAIVHQDE